LSLRIQQLITGTASSSTVIATEIDGDLVSDSKKISLSALSTYFGLNIGTSVNTPSTVVKRDGSGNFSAGTITANLTGIASSASVKALVKTGSHTISSANRGKLFILNSATNKIFTLPAVANGLWYILKNIGVGYMTITPNGTETTECSRLYTNNTVILIADVANLKWRASQCMPVGIQGDIAYNNGYSWKSLVAGTTGKFLKTLGAGANPAWDSARELPASGVQGDIAYHNGTVWVVLSAGTTGKFLKTLGTGANPAWSTIPNSSETVKGIIELATQTETNTGTDDTRAVTPKKLKAFSKVITTAYTSLWTGNVNTATTITLSQNVTNFNQILVNFRPSLDVATVTYTSVIIPVSLLLIKKIGLINNGGEDANRDLGMYLKSINATKTILNSYIGVEGTRISIAEIYGITHTF